MCYAMGDAQGILGGPDFSHILYAGSSARDRNFTSRRFRTCSSQGKELGKQTNMNRKKKTRAKGGLNF